jgi:O-antigen/teichoic acid export membrane protein
VSSEEGDQGSTGAFDDAALEEAELESAAFPTPLEAEPSQGPSGSGISGDHRNILGNTAQNVVGLGVFAVATAVAQVLMTRALGPDRYGIVTQATRFTFIAAAATRFGMDVADVRLVAILAGRGERGRLRGLVKRSVLIAAAVSAVFTVVAFLASGWLASTFSSLPTLATPAFRWAALGVPFAALAFTFMGASRGLKVMRYTLYGQWIGQPISWIVLSLLGWTVVKTAGSTTLAYSLSWGIALLIAWYGWQKLTRGYDAEPTGEGIREEHLGALIRFGALRAPATLFSQMIFFTDLFVLGWLWSGTPGGGRQVGIYGATLQVAQSLFLFLTSVSLTFSPFVADLHHKGARDRLDGLYKTVTRWTLAATIPLLLVLGILPAQVLRIFGREYEAGAPALRILIIGMIVPVMVGTVGFILIMVGRTGWDLLVYMGGFAIDIGVALVLAGPDALGMKGAAIAQALTLSFSAVARLLLVHRFVHIWPFNRQYLRLIIPTALAAGAMYGAHLILPEAKWFVNLVGASLFGTAVYVAAVLAIGLTPTERGQVSNILAKRRARTATKA